MLLLMQSRKPTTDLSQSPDSDGCVLVVVVESRWPDPTPILASIAATTSSRISQSVNYNRYVLHR